MTRPGGGRIALFAPGRRGRSAGRPLQLIAAGALLAAFTASAWATGAPEPLHVNMQNAQFVPKEVYVNLSETVHWTNYDLDPHDVTFESGFGSGAPGGLASGANWSFSFNQTGAFRYRCVVHSASFESGMTGTVRVVDPNAPPPRPVPGPGLGAAIAALGGVAITLSARRVKREE